MAIDTRFLELMQDTVTIYTKTSLDQYGARAWSASGTTYNSHVQPETSVTVDQDGRQISITATVIIYGVATVTSNDKIVLPDGTSPPIISVHQYRDENGSHHTTLRLGR